VTLSDGRFLYWRDPVCVAACATYVVYRWLLPATGFSPLWSGHFTDVLLMPAGLPVWLWVERRIGWRGDDRMPRWTEVAFALVIWTVAAELVAPLLFSQATGDAWDAVAYAGGSAVAGLAWRWPAGVRGVDARPFAPEDGPPVHPGAAFVSAAFGELAAWRPGGGSARKIALR
jgi:hypothetical protein